MSHVKLFIPGPVEISEKTYKAFCRPMVGHRSKDFQELFARTQPGLQKLFATEQMVFVATGSAWSVMEAAIKNLVAKKVLNCMSGAFSDKWHDVALKNAKPAEKLQVDWGKAITASMIEEKLATGEFDAVTLIHNETSTGVMNPLSEIAALKKKFPDVMFIVDCVSSFTVVPTPFDDLGIDVLLAGTQKALALPPGAAVFTVSEAAYEKAAQQKDRGYYLDFLEFRKNGEKNMTPTTPSISHYYALESKIEDILEEGLENRYARHQKNQEVTHEWVKKKGFEFFAEAGYESVSLTCVKNNLGIDVAALQKWLRANKSVAMDGGYGKIKGDTFRISHMGDESTANVEEYLGWIDEGLATL